MGKLYTSRYSNKNLATSKAIKVGISLGSPRFPLRYKLAANLTRLAPSRKIFSLTDKFLFRKLYLEQLDNIGKDEVLKMLETVGYGSDKDVILLCYEDITCDDPCKNWCHRTNLAEWLKTNLGIYTEEYQDDNCHEAKQARKKEKEILNNSIEEQMKLF